MGELFLKNLGQVLKTQSTSDISSTVENGSEAIRVAVLKAANDSEGFSIILFVIFLVILCGLILGKF